MVDYLSKFFIRQGYIKQFKYILATTTTAIIINGCAAIQNTEYPDDWPVITKNNDCPNYITGVFQNRGTHHVKEMVNKQHVNLRGYFTDLVRNITPSGRTSGWKTSINKVQFSILGEEVLKISLWNEDLLRYEHSLDPRNGDYRCTAYGIKIPLSDSVNSSESEGWFSGTATGSYELFRNPGGALIIKEKIRASGMALGTMPVVGIGTTWYQFATVDNGSN